MSAPSGHPDGPTDRAAARLDGGCRAGGGDVRPWVARGVVARLVGLPRFPGEVAAPDAPGAHVMGVTVHAWLGGEPLRRWGPGWLEGGSMALRYRRPLRSGDPLQRRVDHAPHELRIELRDPAGELVADAAAWLNGPDLPAPASFVDAEPLACRLAPEPEALAGRGLGSLEFDFAAPRDLEVLDGLEPDDPYRLLGVAHPAWVATGVNALIAGAIDMTAGRWKHAGTAVRSLRPIPPGSRVRLVGRVERLFEAGRHRFADVAVLVAADGRPAAVFLTAIVYG